MIDWKKYFDAIYCLNLANFTERRQDMTCELQRVGIADSGILQWKTTVRNGFYKYIYENPNFPVDNWWVHLTGCMNCTMAHYEIMLECLVRGYERVMVIEDDVRFLKNIGEIATILDNMPIHDVCMFDKNIPWEKHDFRKAVKYNRVNDYYIDFTNVRLNSTGCYAVSKKAMNHVVESQEKFFRPADEALNAKGDDDLIRVASVKNMAVQDLARYKEELTDVDRVIYEGIVNLNEYEL